MNHEDTRITKEDGSIWDVKKIVTWDAWREKSIITSWETDGWKHIGTNEYRNGHESCFLIYFERKAENG